MPRRAGAESFITQTDINSYNPFTYTARRRASKTPHHAARRRTSTRVDARLCVMLRRQPVLISALCDVDMRYVNGPLR